MTRYLTENGVAITPSHQIDNFAMGISLVASTRGVALLPAYVKPLLPRSVVSRPLSGDPPTIDLAIAIVPTTRHRCSGRSSAAWINSSPPAPPECGIGHRRALDADQFASAN